jgi:hypothetical protein
MQPRDDAARTRLTTIEHEGRRIAVACRMTYDGIEWVGRLWFEGGEPGETAIPDRGSVPGRNPNSVLELAGQLTTDELTLRYCRALAEKRRFVRLRAVTDEILAKVRYLNQIAITVRAGLLDKEGADQEMELTEQQLHECIGRLREVAGAEDD